MKTAIVTGGNRGLGFLIAQQLAAQGWRVVVGSRSLKNGEEAAARIREAVSGAEVEARQLDVSSFANVREFASDWTEPLDALVNNAGMMTTPGHPMQRSVDGHELTMATNAWGPTLLTALLLPRLQAAAPARIVNVCSRSVLGFAGMGGPVHWDWDNLDGEKDFVGVEAYKSSKLALAWLTFELARRLDASSVTVNAVCPGFVPSTVADQTTGFQHFLFQHILTHVPGAHPAPEAAANIAWAVTDPSLAGVTGQYFGEREPIDLDTPVRYDTTVGERLWELTWQMTGVTDSTLSELGLQAAP